MVPFLPSSVLRVCGGGEDALLLNTECEVLCRNGIVKGEGLVCLCECLCVCVLSRLLLGGLAACGTCLSE